jgi:lysophospholipase L1-like esterase
MIGCYFAIPVLDIFNAGNYNPYLFPNLSIDELHPNDEGHERLAKTIACKINSL